MVIYDDHIKYSRICQRKTDAQGRQIEIISKAKNIAFGVASDVALLKCQESDHFEDINDAINTK